MTQTILKSAQDFAQDIEEIVYMLDCSYMEAIMKWCRDNNIEVETAGDLVKKSAPIKSKLQAEAEELNNVKKGT